MFKTKKVIWDSLQIAIRLVSVSFICFGIYFMLFLALYFTVLRTNGQPENLATGNLGSFFLLYFPVFLGAIISTWVIRRRIRRVGATKFFCALLLIAGALSLVCGVLLLPMLLWAWLNLLLVFILFLIGAFASYCVQYWLGRRLNKSGF